MTLTPATSGRRRVGLIRRALGWLMIALGAALVLAGAAVVFSGPHTGEQWYLRDVSGWAGIGVGLVVFSLGIVAAVPGRQSGWWS